MIKTVLKNKINQLEIANKRLLEKNLELVIELDKLQDLLEKCKKQNEKNQN